MEILQENHCYPFGLKMEGKWAPQIGKENKYGYNGKELDEDFGLNWHHYGFRMYDAAIGRFPSADPVAENFAHVSSYNYAENNPTSGIDLWGLQHIRADVAWDDPGLRSINATHKEVRAFQKDVSTKATAGVLASGGVIAGGLPAMIEGGGLLARSIYGAGRTMAGKAPGFFKGLFAGSMGERAAAMGADATIQLVATMPATGSDFNFASTLSAGLFPQQYALSGALGGGLGLSITQSDQGKWSMNTSINPVGFVVGTVAGAGAGKLGDGVEALAKSSNSGARAQAGAKVNFLSNNKEDAVAAKNTIKSLFSLFGAVGSTVVNESTSK